MNAMSALYHIAQNDSPKLSTPAPIATSEESSNTAPCTPPVVQWSDEFKLFIQVCLKKQPSERPSAQSLLEHPFILAQSDRKALTELIRKTKDIVRDLDNLQYRKMKKLIMIETCGSENSRMLNTSGEQSCTSSLANLKNDGSETSQLEDVNSQILDDDDDDVDDDDDEYDETSSMQDHLNHSVSDTDLENLNENMTGLNMTSNSATSSSGRKNGRHVKNNSSVSGKANRCNATEQIGTKVCGRNN